MFGISIENKENERIVKYFVQLDYLPDELVDSIFCYDKGFILGVQNANRSIRVGGKFLLKRILTLVII